MSDLITRLDGWLTPARRRLIHQTIAATGVLLVTAGAVREDIVTGALGVAGAVLAVGSQVLAALKARRVDMTRLYAAAAAVIIALRVAGAISDGTSSHWLDITAAAAAVIGPWLAAARTDTATPTGEPAEEYAARHRAPDGTSR